MKIQPGLAGIRKFRNDNADKAGWHIFVDGAYMGFNGGTVSALFEDFPATFTFTGWGGNTLHFTTQS